MAVSVRGVSQPLLVAVRDFPFGPLFDVDLRITDLPGLPDGLRKALQDGVRGVIRSMLPPILAEHLEFGDEGSFVAISSSKPSEDREWMAVRLSQQNGLFVDLLVGWSRRLIAERVSRGVLGAAQTLAPIAEHLTLPAFATLGAITMTLGELQTLETGAAVVLAEGDGLNPKIRIGEVLFAFAATDGGWHCSGPLPLDRYQPRASLVRRDKDPAMENDSQEEDGTSVSGEHEGGISLGDLKVAVDFDLGRSMVPLATVAGWQPATVVDLALPAVADGVEVTIRVNGDVVGQGDLVRIDDRIAVRITRFALRG